MKAYKIELLIIDLDEIGEDSIRREIDNVRYISPQVKSMECADIGQWRDDHPLNRNETADEEYLRLFKNK